LVVIPAEVPRQARDPELVERAGIQKTVLDAVRSVEREPRISLVNIAEGVSFTKRIWDYPFRRVGSTLDKGRFSLIFSYNHLPGFIIPSPLRERVRVRVH
jgi:hypothetical protein